MAPILRTRGGMKILMALMIVIVLGGCGEVPRLEELAPEESCRQTLHVGPVGVPVDDAVADRPPEVAAQGDTTDAADPDLQARPGRPDVEWKAPGDAAQRAQLNAWCAAVGPAVFGGWAELPARDVDSLVVVAWNVHVGGGDMRRLVHDLREGAFTDGRAVEHFVLLVQEAYREDDTVPVFDPALPQGGGVYDAPPGRPRTDIVAEARELGLSLFYAPSMRNGEAVGDETPEDRGNAILSTLPLVDPLALELPVARQRRVAVAARVVTGVEEDRRLLVSSVHLENDAAGWRRDEEARLEQARALIDGLPDDDAAIAGGDFNTWSRGWEEALVQAMLREFPDTPAFPTGHTYVRAYGLLRRYLDYVFLRLPDDATSRVTIVPDPYASDHLPVVTEVILPPREQAGDP